MNDNQRHSEYKILPLFLQRRSLRVLSGETITKHELLSLFEAARWAPSSFNNQPWRFIYAQHATAYWDLFFNLLTPSNQAWVKNAAVLVLVVSAQVFERSGTFSRTHSFDTGAAWENLALQAASMNLVAHGMEGFDYVKAREVLSIPESYTVEAMVAIGRPEIKESAQSAEKPTQRKKLEEIIAEGNFSNFYKPGS